MHLKSNTRADDRPPLAMFLGPRDVVSHYVAIRLNLRGKHEIYFFHLFEVQRVTVIEIILS